MGKIEDELIYIYIFIKMKHINQLCSGKIIMRTNTKIRHYN